MGFAADLNKMCARAGDKAELVVRRTALELQSGMVEKSAVGDPSGWKGPAPEGYTGGRFKGNWQVGIGVINTVTDSPLDKGGESTIARAKIALENWKPGQTIYLSNSLPYGRRLEYEGWSAQCPAGMVRLTVQAYSDAVKKAVESIK
ncbi:HK97 gp10 family phage protein [Acidovorax kalamii]|uniref:HK97 gp10 family phage protein n=1 Tax=Acidovorax kalamii TaxID=2004485 RepID=UPI0020903162|nr:HK97 gp10 family phage protein [Acidovorax kalamii]MCO5355062.1 HK97 gp10 family phage protein [Acidovorax kalamii]